MYLKFDVRWFSGAQGSPFLTSVLINQLEAWERKHNKDIREITEALQALLPPNE